MWYLKKTYNTHRFAKFFTINRKTFEAAYKDIYKSPYNFNSYFDKDKHPKDDMYTKLLKIFIPQLTLTSF